MSRFWSNLFTLSAGGALVLAALFVWAHHRLAAPGPAATETTFTVVRGEGLREIADRLQDDGLIDSAALFAVWARVRGVAGDLQAGDYAVASGASMVEILNAMTEGRAVQHRVTVVPGTTVAQVIALLDATEVLSGDVGEVPPEGSLAPDTYFVARGQPRSTVIALMRRTQTQRLERLWAARVEPTPLQSPDEALILASIIEKETGLDGERSLVAGVFINRLNQGMRLQSDPTVVYGVTNGSGPLERPISRSDLRTPTPWNTYTIDRLPPTPIANPSEAAIEAALNPAETEYLFFVADGTGGHAFARTYPEHQENVERWREIERQQRAASN